MKQILIATTNQGKAKEMQSICQDLPVKIITLSDLSPTTINNLDVQETGATFAENAAIKAKAYAQASGLLTICDDSGLEVKALDGRPGVFSKRYGSTDQERNLRLLKELEDVKDSDRNARFVCVIAIHDPSANQTYFAEGIVEGEITREPDGDNGFGYDPVFYSHQLKKTFATATTGEKNRISHRARALKKAKPIIQTLI